MEVFRETRQDHETVMARMSPEARRIVEEYLRDIEAWKAHGILTGVPAPQIAQEVRDYYEAKQRVTFGRVLRDHGENYIRGAHGQQVLDHLKRIAGIVPNFGIQALVNLDHDYVQGQVADPEVIVMDHNYFGLVQGVQDRGTLVVENVGEVNANQDRKLRLEDGLEEEHIARQAFFTPFQNIFNLPLGPRVYAPPNNVVFGPPERHEVEQMEHRQRQGEEDGSASSSAEHRHQNAEVDDALANDPIYIQFRDFARDLALEDRPVFGPRERHEVEQMERRRRQEEDGDVNVGRNRKRRRVDDGGDGEEDEEDQQEEPAPPAQPPMPPMTIVTYLNIVLQAHLQSQQQQRTAAPDFSIENLLSITNAINYLPSLLLNGPQLTEEEKNAILVSAIPGNQPPTPPPRGDRHLIEDYEDMLTQQVQMVKTSMQAEAFRDDNNRNNFIVKMQQALLVTNKAERDARTRFRQLREDFDRGTREGQCAFVLIQLMSQEVTVTMTEFLAQTNRVWKQLQEEGSRIRDVRERANRCDIFPAVFQAIQTRLELYNIRFSLMRQLWETSDEEHNNFYFTWLLELENDVHLSNKLARILFDAQKMKWAMMFYKGGIPQEQFDEIQDWTIANFRQLNQQFEMRIERIYREFMMQLDRHKMIEERQETEQMAENWLKEVSIAFARFRGQCHRRNMERMNPEQRMHLMIQQQREELARYNGREEIDDDGDEDDEEEEEEVGAMDGVEEQDRMVIREILEEEEALAHPREGGGEREREREREEVQEVQEEEDDETLMRRLQGVARRKPESQILHLPPDGNLIWTSWDENKVWAWIETFLPEVNQKIHELDFDGYALFQYLNDTNYWHASTMPLASYLKLKASMNRLINHYNKYS